MDVATKVVEREEKEFEEFLKNQIKEFNNRTSRHFLEARQAGATTALNIILKDEEGSYLGGLSASTYWGWLDVDDLYLPEELRGQGIGASLLEQAESIALGRGCFRAVLSTYGFQARGFYEKRGYHVVGKLEDYPPGSSYYWMRKDLLSDGR